MGGPTNYYSLFGIQGYSALKAWVKVSETKHGGEIWDYNKNRIWDVQFRFKKYCSKVPKLRKKSEQH